MNINDYLFSSMLEKLPATMAVRILAGSTILFDDQELTPSRVIKVI